MKGIIENISQETLEVKGGCLIYIYYELQEQRTETLIDRQLLF
jgi:hypothetical protein